MPAAGLDRGRLIENLVACELARVSRDLAYVKTASGLEVDFLATDFEGKRQMIQSVSDVSSRTTWEREVKALVEARKEIPDASALIIVEDMPPYPPPQGVQVALVQQWLLNH